MTSPTSSDSAPRANSSPGFSRVLLFWIALMLLVMGGTILTLAIRSLDRNSAGNIGIIESEYLNAPQTEPGKFLTEFSLTERSGRKVSSAELSGKPYLASFFYSMCPAECIQQNTKLGELAREFVGSDFRFLSISCDPEVDHPARLREYADKFNARSDSWLFLTGELIYIRRIGAEIYQVPVDLRSHTERFIAVDRNGKVRGHFNWKDPAQLTALRKQMKTLLEEKASPAEEATTKSEPPSQLEEGK